MASIIWSGDLFSISLSLYRAGASNKLNFLVADCDLRKTNKCLVSILQEGDGWANFHVLSFSGMDPSYVLPDNVAMITLQVYILCLVNLLLFVQ